MSNLPIIALIDMDCFFVQVEQRGKPELDGKPCVVTQYNVYKGGGIIAVNYEARACGIKRGMWGEDALKVCNNLTIFHTPKKRGKADSSKYREASFEVFDVLTKFDSSIVIEKASIDEAYLDLTDYIKKNKNIAIPTAEEITDCYVDGIPLYDQNESSYKKFIKMVLNDPETYQDELNLLKGAKIMSDIRKEVLKVTQFQCSAGISHSKVLAKLAAGLHKPRAQTILPNCCKKEVLAKTPIKKLRHLGGKLGLQIIDRLNIEFVDQINNFNFDQLKIFFGEKTADYILNLANGKDDEPVVARKLSKSIGCGKNFSSVGSTCLNTKEKVEYWIGQLVDELLERVEKDKEMNNRKPTLLIVGMDVLNVGTSSRSTSFDSFDKQRLIDNIMNRVLIPTLFKKSNKAENPIKLLSVAATKFIELCDQKNTLDTFFSKMSKKAELNKSIPNIDKPCTSTSVLEKSSNNEEKSSNDSGNKSLISYINKELKIPNADFPNVSSKQLMDEYFKELEKDVQPKEVEKPKLTIVNMFNKIAQQNEQDQNKKKEVGGNEDENKSKEVSENEGKSKEVVVIKNNINSLNSTIQIDPKAKKLNSKPSYGIKNFLLSQPTNNLNTIKIETTPYDQINQPTSSYVAMQINLLRQQNLLDEDELKKLEEELLRDIPRPVIQKEGFFSRKTKELRSKKRLKT